MPPRSNFFHFHAVLAQKIAKNRLAHLPLRLPTLWEILVLLLLKHSRYPTDPGSDSYSAGNASKKNQNALF